MQIQEKKAKNLILMKKRKSLPIFLEKMGDMSSLMPCKQKIELFWTARKDISFPELS